MTLPPEHHAPLPTSHRSPVLAVASLLACAIASACSASAPADPEPHYAVSAPVDPTDELFAPENLVRLDLELSPDSLQRLAQSPYEYAVGTLRYRDQTLDSIGVRLKGEASFRELDDKPAFRLKLDEFVRGQ